LNANQLHFTALVVRGATRAVSHFKEVTMTALPRSNGFPEVIPGMRLLGEVVTWDCSGITVRHLDLVDSLTETGLDASVARELAPRHAFTRACKKLAQQRIIRQVAEDDHTIHFQFTAEQKEGNRFSYDFETLLLLEKSSGRVRCDLPGLAALAQEELDRCIAHRTGADISRIVQRLFERRADLFPIRKKGAAYFLPLEHVGFAERVQSFLGRVNGQLNRFPIPAGTPHGDRSVQDAVARGLAELISEHRQAIAMFGEDTREATLHRAAERIRVTRHKVGAYSEYLAEERVRLERELADAARDLRTKVESLSATRDGAEVGIA
jgi:hypothetical protein